MKEKAEKDVTSKETRSKQSASTWKWGCIIAMTAAILLVISYSFDTIRHAEFKDKYSGLDRQYEVVLENSHKMLKEKTAVEKDRDDLKQRLADQNGHHEAIVSYILINYKRVPLEIANSVAENLIKLCTENSLPYELIMGVIEVESSFNPSAVSNKGARGLMQVMPGIWKEKLGLKSEFDLHQVKVGLESGIRVLNIILKEQKGNLSKALYHYVGKDNSYVNNVYKAMSAFILHRFLI